MSRRIMKIVLAVGQIILACCFIILMVGLILYTVIYL